MNKTQYFLAFAFIGMSIMFFACKKEKTVVGKCVSTSNVSFDTIIKPLILTNCSTSGCHGSGAGGYTLTTHASISASADIMLKAMRHESGVSAMPQGAPKLSDSSVINFDCWVLQGKLNN